MVRRDYLAKPAHPVLISDVWRRSELQGMDGASAVAETSGPRSLGCGPTRTDFSGSGGATCATPKFKIYTATANTLQRIPYSPKISRPPILPPSHGTFGLLGGKDSEADSADSGSAPHCFEQSDESTYGPTSLPWVWGIFIGHVSEIGGMHRVTARRRARPALEGNRCGTYQRKTLNPSG